MYLVHIWFSFYVSLCYLLSVFPSSVWFQCPRNHEFLSLHFPSFGGHLLLPSWFIKCRLLHGRLHLIVSASLAQRSSLSMFTSMTQISVVDCTDVLRFRMWNQDLEMCICDCIRFTFFVLGRLLPFAAIDGFVYMF
jgi:hypothetical protein